MLKRLQRLAIFVCNFSRGFLTDKCIANFKSGSRSSSACNAVNFFHENP